MKKKISVRRWFARSHHVTAYGHSPVSRRWGFFFRGPDPRPAIRGRGRLLARLGTRLAMLAYPLRDTKVLGRYRLSPTWRSGLVSHGLLGFLNL
jgi:hypothetical protein